MRDLGFRRLVCVGLISIAGCSEASPLPSDAGITTRDVGPTDSAVALAEGGPLDASAKPVAFESAGQIAAGRISHTATLLEDGRVLVVGGESGLGGPILRSTELYDPVANIWSAGPDLPAGRSNHIAVRLADGRVLIAGGGRASDRGYPDADMTDTSLIFDPTSDAFSEAAPLMEARSHARAVLLTNGEVLIAGGGSGRRAMGALTADALASAELYDPEASAWRTVGAMTETRFFHELVALENGRAMVIGGVNETESSSATFEIFDGEGSWTEPMTGFGVDRFRHTATALPGGRVLLAAGKQSNIRFLTDAWLWDGESWAEVTGLVKGGNGGTLTSLPSGAAVLIGGYGLFPPGSSYEALDAVQRFGTSSGSFATVTRIARARSLHTTTLLANGEVLVVGGFNENGRLVGDCERSVALE